MQQPATLEREALRLRFSDAALERRFHDERQALGLTRARVMMVAGALVVGAFGVVEVANVGRVLPQYLESALTLRFLIVAPLWLLMAASTWVKGHRERADWVFAAGTVMICWALGLIKWHFGWHVPERELSGIVTGDIFVALLVSVAALPMRFGAVAVTALASVAGVSALFLATTAAARGNDARNIAFSLAGVALLTVVLSWFREGAERRTFAQREQVRRLNDELSRLNAEKNEFMAIAAHDLRAPLASVRGLADLLRSERLAEPEKRRRAHEAIHELTGSMLALVNDYLGTHAAETGQLPVRSERVDLRAAAQAVAERQAVTATGKRQQLRVDGGAPVMVRADAALLGQVADNFVSNALKFSPPDSTVTLTVAVADDGSCARLQVRDEGPGVAPEEVEQVFRKFGRGSARPTGGESSHGLGLAVTKRLAAAMGGRVGCDAEAGRGATFWIELPVE
ncbi:MAG: HAMP domain-containing sensor histidine kinase [Candidatus Didemnitutus sp.]|nr:HAMP domain-containing sensor histidine kinase [Candidatus Didemnitutus sp.]